MHIEKPNRSQGKFTKLKLALVNVLLLCHATLGFEVVSGEYLVQLKNDVSVNTVEAMISSSPGNGKILNHFKELNVLHVQVPENVAESLHQTTQNPNSSIEYIEPNYVYYANPEGTLALESRVPDDTKILDMWYLEKIGAFEGWSHLSESKDIIVAVIDTGVFMKHEDLEGNIWTNEDEIPDNGIDDDHNGFIDDIHGWDFYNNMADPTCEKVPVDQIPPLCVPHATQKRYEIHGTHVAGTIGAIANNATGVAGISWKVNIMPLKFLGGICGGGNTANAIRAIDYAVAQGAHIINASWGGGAKSEFLKQAIERAAQQNVLFVAAAGNSAQNNDLHPHYPSSYDIDNIIAVAATTFEDRLASFSCFGNESVDIAVPGVAILNCIPEGNEDNEVPESGYRTLQGTSMATPILAGACALVMAKHRDITCDKLKQLLFKTCDRIPELRGKIKTGGRLNFARVIGDLPLPKRHQKAISQLGQKERTSLINRGYILNNYLSPNQALNIESQADEPIASLPQNPVPTITKSNQLNAKFEVLIKLHESDKTNTERVLKQVTTHLSDETGRASVETVSKAGNVYKVTTSRGGDTQAILKNLKSIKGIAAAEENHTFSQEQQATCLVPFVNNTTSSK